MGGWLGELGEGDVEVGVKVVWILEADAEADHAVADADERAVMLVGGEAEIEGHPLGPYELTVLRPERDMTLASTRGGRVMLLGGEAFATKRHVWWNFVSSSRERIHQAREDWRKERFPLVPGDSEERIPIPDGQPKTVSYP